MNPKKTCYDSETLCDKVTFERWRLWKLLVAAYVSAGSWSLSGNLKKGGRGYTALQ